MSEKKCKIIEWYKGWEKHYPDINTDSARAVSKIDADATYDTFDSCLNAAKNGAEHGLALDLEEMAAYIFVVINRKAQFLEGNTIYEISGNAYFTKLSSF